MPRGKTNNPQGKNQYTLGGAARAVKSMIYNPAKHAQITRAENRVNDAKNAYESNKATVAMNIREISAARKNNDKVIDKLGNDAIAKRRQAKAITGIRDFFDTPNQIKQANTARDRYFNAMKQEADNRRSQERLIKALDTEVGRSAGALNKANRDKVATIKAVKSDAAEKAYLRGYVKQTKQSIVGAERAVVSRVSSLFGSGKKKR